MRKLLLLVLVLFASNAFGEAIADLRKKAAAGDAEAQTTLGVRYANGRGVRKNYKEAVKWYHKAAEQGDAAGQYNLGLMYRKGRGVRKDYVTAYAWYRLAAYSDFKGGSKSRETIAKEMTPEQFAEAQELSKELLKKIEANKKADKREDSSESKQTSVAPLETNQSSAETPEAKTAEVAKVVVDGDDIELRDGLFYFKGEPFTGVAVEKADNGQKEWEATLKDGKPDGLGSYWRVKRK